jgi:hypothetical protein
MSSCAWSISYQKARLVFVFEWLRCVCFQLTVLLVQFQVHVPEIRRIANYKVLGNILRMIRRRCLRRVRIARGGERGKYANG